MSCPEMGPPGGPGDSLPPRRVVVKLLRLGVTLRLRRRRYGELPVVLCLKEARGRWRLVVLGGVRLVGRVLRAELKLVMRGLQPRLT